MIFIQEPKKKLFPLCVTSVFKIMEMELSDMTTEEVLCSYSSVKGHRTRCERKIANLLELLQAQYSVTSELHLNDRLEKLEKHSHRLLDIAEYLVCIKCPKARDHSEEVKEFMETCKVLHRCFHSAS